MTWIVLLTLAGLCNECNASVWELHYQNEPVIGGVFETKDECESALSEIDLQTPAFTSLECVEVPAIRHDS